jgi:hypothetical protein
MSHKQHEHDDHPHFACILEARLREGEPHDRVKGDAPVPDADLTEDNRRETEYHALIYTDGFIALTIFECCYALWSVATGEVEGGSLWRRRQHVLTPASLQVLRRHAEGALSVQAASLGGRVVAARELLGRIPLARVADHERAMARLAVLEQAWSDARDSLAHAQDSAQVVVHDAGGSDD